MLDSGVLDMHCLEQFAHFRSQKLLNFVFKFGLDLINKLLGLSSLLLSFTHLIALHEFHQICKLERLLSGVLEYHPPLVIRVDKGLSWIELFLILGLNHALAHLQLIVLFLWLILLSQAHIIAHWHSISIDTFSNTSDFRV